MKKRKYEYGITLIALVVTIILIIILVGVSISSLTGENGLLTRTSQAKRLTEAKSEEEAMQMMVTLSSMEKNLNNSNKYYIGTKLYDKSIVNGNKWNIIVINDTQEQYGTGWNYIEEGTNISSYGITKNNWLINYETGEIIKLEKENYTNLSYKSGLAVTDGLVFNLDATNIQDSNSWGDGVKLYGFENNEESMYKGNALKFDGVDDYISVDGNLNVSDKITLEFYGKINGYSENNWNYIPIMDAYNAKSTYTNGGCMRLFMLFKNQICANFGYASCGNSNIWESEQSPQNLDVTTEINLNTDNMFTVTYNHKNLTYSVYKNGELVQRAILANTYWENFIQNEIPNIKYFRIGTTTWNGVTGYYNGLVYSARIYNKALTDEEVLENYNKAVAYHNLDG